MPSFHEFDVALTPSTPATAATSRTPTNEVHLNVWLAGVKGTPSAVLSDSTNVGAGIGLTLAASRAAVLSNAPAELILGDASGAWVLNVADLKVQPGVGGTTLFSGVYLF